MPHDIVVANASSFQSFKFKLRNFLYYLFFLFCFAGFLVVLFVVNAHVAVICRGNTELPFCMILSYGCLGFQGCIKFPDTKETDKMIHL